MCLFPLLLWSLSFVTVSRVARIRIFVEPQSFYFSTKRAHSCTVTQEEMRFEEPQVKALPAIEKKNEAAYTIAKLVLVI